MNRHLILDITIALLLCLFFPLCLKAQGIVERAYVHTDKDCYVAGEDIWVKLFVVDNRFQPSYFSKVGYVEICDTQKPWVQLKLTLENGSGAGKMEIPSHIPSGIYELSGYTRYMKNEGESIFFKKQIAIINVGQYSFLTDRIELINPAEKQWDAKQEETNIRVKTNTDEYSNRSLVQLSIDDLPENITDLVVSVSREDSLILLPEIDKQRWIRQVTSTPVNISSYPLIPEYEGHIITASVTPKPQGDRFMPNVAFVGKNIHYTNGQTNQTDGIVSFYTTDVYGPQELVASVAPMQDEVRYQMSILSPFSESLPDNLPALQVRLNNKPLKERYIGTQLKNIFVTDTIDDKPLLASYYHLHTPVRYDLNDYKRFETLGETIFEFVTELRVQRVDGKRKIRVSLEETDRYNISDALVLLDGVPVYEHEDLLNYNPQHLRMIDVYNNYYILGGEIFEGIVSLTTHSGNLPFFQLREDSRLFIYDCPVLPSGLETPDYSDTKNSREPDFRHTLYWNPFIKPLQEKSTQLSFYTSDLTGVFKVTVEGITKDGKMVYGTSHFKVVER